MARMITCPGCGNRGRIGVTRVEEGPLAFLVRGHLGARPVVKCTACGRGIFDRPLFGPKLIEPDLWQRMQQAWTAEFGDDELLEHEDRAGPSIGSPPRAPSEVETPRSVREVYLIEVLGASRRVLRFMLPLSLVLNVVVAVVSIFVRLLLNILNPFLMLAAVLDAPLVLWSALAGTVVTAITGRRKVAASDFGPVEQMELRAGRTIRHGTYGTCKLVEILGLNENNVTVSRRAISSETTAQ